MAESDDDARRKARGNLPRRELDEWAGVQRLDPLDAYEMVGAPLVGEYDYLDDEASARLVKILRASYDDIVATALGRVRPRDPGRRR